MLAASNAVLKDQFAEAQKTIESLNKSISQLSASKKQGEQDLQEKERIWKEELRVSITLSQHYKKPLYSTSINF